jgi:hypothetical protein
MLKAAKYSLANPSTISEAGLSFPAISAKPGSAAMLREYGEEFEVFVDDDEVAGTPERVVTAAEISKVDQRIRDAVNGTVRADGFAVNNEIDDGSRRRRTDADSGELVDKVLRHFDDALRMHCDAINKRMDALEEKYTKRADKRHDGHFDEGEEGEEGEHKREKDDGDLTLKHEGRDKDEDEPAEDLVDKTKARQVMASSHADSAPADGDACAQFRVAADDAMSGLGTQTPRPLAGETYRAYRVRVLRSLKRHSPGFAKVDLSDFRGPALDAVCNQILSDARKAGERGPDDVPEGQLREVIKIDPTTGRRMSLFYGPSTFIKMMKRPARHVKSFWPAAGARIAPVERAAVPALPPVPPSSWPHAECQLGPRPFRQAVEISQKKQKSLCTGGASAPPPIARRSRFIEGSAWRAASAASCSLRRL